MLFKIFQFPRGRWYGLISLIFGLMLLSLCAQKGFAQPDSSVEANGWAYSSYLGSDAVDEAHDITVDTNGNIYVLGKTGADNFLGSSHQIAGYDDLFVAKFNPAGTQLLYVTLLGSPDSDEPKSIKVDGQGNVFVTASALSNDFPMQNALWNAPPQYWDDGVLFKLNPSGALVFSTYLPFDVFDAEHNLAVDSAGNAYVTGTSFFGDVGNQIGMLKISPNGAQVLLEQNVGGPDSEIATAIALDNAGNIYLTGTTGDGHEFPVTSGAHQAECGDTLYGDNWYCYEDGVVIVLNSAGTVTYSSHHGGSFTDEPVAIAADGQGNILLAGNTTSGVFPLAQPLQATCPLDANQEDCTSPRGFVSVIHVANGVGTLTYSTYLGSSEAESTNVVTGALMDSTGHATVLGYTNGHTSPLANPLQNHLADSFCTTFGSDRYCFDAFIVTFTPSGGLSFGTYLGATFDDFPYGITQDGTGNLYVTGVTEADDFPTTSNAFQPENFLSDDGFIVKVGGSTPPPPPPADNFQVFLPLITR